MDTASVCACSILPERCSPAAVRSPLQLFPGSSVVCHCSCCTLSESFVPRNIEIDRYYHEMQSDATGGVKEEAAEGRKQGVQHEAGGVKRWRCAPVLPATGGFWLLPHRFSCSPPVLLSGRIIQIIT